MIGSRDAVEDAYSLLGRYPNIGATRYGYDLDIVGLRTWTLQRFPCVILYVEPRTHVEIWRVLHNRREIPASMLSPE